MTINLLFTLIIVNGISGKIQGVVRDIDTQEPIPFADVIILNTEIGAATDENGYFHILNVPPGKYTVEVSYIGYQTKRIEDVIVDVDQTARLKVAIKQTTIEMAPITVTSEMPAVKKDMVGTTYIIRKSEVAHLPIDYAVDLITFQAAVAHTDTTIHVRGGRATEVQYMIDNVSIIDPQTGDLAINVSKGIVDEVIFLPGGFDAEYGRAMSGVINLITSYPADNLQLSASMKTERIMPFYYNFGYENYQSSIHLPISKRFKGFVSFDVMHADDWDPKLYILPHKWRDDYSVYGKCIFAPSGKFKLTLSGAKSSTQFDRYNSLWQFYLDHYRSDMRQSDLEALSISYLPDSRKLFNLTLSRLNTIRIYGVREPDSPGYFENFTFRDYHTLVWPKPSARNPYGVYVRIPYSDGDYTKYEDKSSLVMKANLSTNLQIHKYHELKAGVEYTYQSLDNFTCFVSDSLHQIIDEYHYYPKEYFVYLQDNIDFEGLYAKIGCRYDYFSSDIEGADPKIMISPRIGVSFMVTDKFLFRANLGRYTQPPLYDYMYGYYNVIPLPSYITAEGYLPLVGNPELGPEKTTSYEIGLQGEIRNNLFVSFTTFYKDIVDLIGARFVEALPHDYVEYENIEYANVKGIETVLDFTNSIFTGKFSYTLSWARGTSSYAQEVYKWITKDPEFLPEAKEYDLDFDQRHRIFIQGIINLPVQTQLYLFGYFGQGFPYTPPGPEGKYEERNIYRIEFQRQIDCVISKSFRIGRLSLNANLEIINVLDTRYEVAAHFPLIPLESINPWDFTDYITLRSSYYSPPADINHDGLNTPYESYMAYRGLYEETDDWVNANSAPRRARIGLTINF
ncbi:TonB-dependent receptor [candidate division WOR-3 bacterium]|nr:TonB-dependent receptor [candidate division WOR-3 bacterium]